MIRTIKASDIVELQDIIEDALYLADPNAVPSETYMLEALTIAMKPSTSFYLKVCEEDGHIVGFLAAQVTQSFMLSTKQTNVITSYAKPDYQYCLKELFEDMCKWAYSLAAYDVYVLSQENTGGLSLKCLDELGAKPISSEYLYQLDRD